MVVLVAQETVGLVARVVLVGVREDLVVQVMALTPGVVTAVRLVVRGVVQVVQEVVRGVLGRADLEDPETAALAVRAVPVVVMAGMDQLQAEAAREDRAAPSQRHRLVQITTMEDQATEVTMAIPLLLLNPALAVVIVVVVMAVAAAVGVEVAEAEVTGMEVALVAVQAEVVEMGLEAEAVQVVVVVEMAVAEVRDPAEVRLEEMDREVPEVLEAAAQEMVMVLEELAGMVGLVAEVIPMTLTLLLGRSFAPLRTIC